MKKSSLMAAMAAVVAGAVLATASAHAQTTPIGVWQPTQQEQSDPARRVPATPQPTTETSHSAPQPEPVAAPAAAYPQPYSGAPPAPSRDGQDRGGFFLGVQGGKGRVFEDVDQAALMVNAGYRWQAGAVTLVGIEAAGGRLEDTSHHDEYFGEIDYASLGANARFNFGLHSPVYGLVRGGYWLAHDGAFGSIEGGYFGVGLGVDFNRHFNMSLVYTNHVYFQDYYWEGDDFYYDLNRADTLMLGAEVRF